DLAGPKGSLRPPLRVFSRPRSRGSLYADSCQCPGDLIYKSICHTRPRSRAYLYDGVLLPVSFPVCRLSSLQMIQRVKSTDRLDVRRTDAEATLSGSAI
ncbi:hypothetical protein GOODEAATRI_009840, partial [Goodea atripinnis]